jgi:hypothetical protein
MMQKKKPNANTPTEHARLKDHIATMDGGLEAKIHEGFVTPASIFDCFIFTSPLFAILRLTF